MTRQLDRPNSFLMGLRRFYLIMLRRVSVGAAPSPHRPTGTPAHHGRRGQSGRRGGRHSARGRHRTPSISRCRALPPQFASLAPMRGPRSAEYRALHVLAPAARTASRVRRGRLPGLLHSARPRPSASCSPRAPPPPSPLPPCPCRLLPVPCFRPRTAKVFDQPLRAEGHWRSYEKRALVAFFHRSNRKNSPYLGFRDPTRSVYAARNTYGSALAVMEAQKRGWDFERFN